MPKHYLSFHTVFILSENIQWLEEFIIYYNHLGFDHFYLYDNEGSIGRNGSTTTKNKYGFPLNYSDENTTRLQAILLKYGESITYIKWQPRNEAGNIIYGQHESIADCIAKYGDDNEWMAFMDLDEFIISPNNTNVLDYLKTQDDTVSCVRLIQKKFVDRFLVAGPLVTQDFRCINDLHIDNSWGPKNIIRCKDFRGSTNIHWGFTLANKTSIVAPDIVRFNHYNTNDTQLKWMKGFFKRSSDFSLNGIDDGMAIYARCFL